MGDLFRQLGSMLGASFAALCCLGASWALAMLAAIGAGFLINDAILIPLYVAFLALNLWLLRRSSRAHSDRRPFFFAAAGALAAIAGLFIPPAVVYAGLAAMVLAGFWDYAAMRARRAAGART